MTAPSPTGSARRVTLDAGALIALDRSHRPMWARLRRATERRASVTVPAPVVAQVWRSARQANLSRALGHCEIEATDAALARAAGVLCARAERADAVDAIVIASAARRGDAVITSDPDDMRALAAHVDGVTVIAI